MIVKILASCFLVWLTIAANVTWAQNAPANFHQIDNAARERSAQVFERHASSQPLDGAQAVKALRIEAVERGSQADTLGLKPGEFLLRYDGKPFASAEAFPAVVQARAAQPGSVPLQVLGNGGQVRSVTAAPGRMGVVPRLAVWRAPVRAPQGYGVSVQSGQAVWSMETDRTGRWAASADMQGNIKVWDLPRQRELTAIPSHGQAIALRLSPSGTYTLVQTMERLFVWHNLSGAQVWERKLPINWSADWGTDDTHVWVDEGKAISLWHVPTDLSVGFWPADGRSGVPAGLNRVQASPDGERLLTFENRLFPGLLVDSLALQLGIFHKATGQWSALPDAAKHQLSTATWSRDGRSIFVGAKNGRVGRMDASTLSVQWFDVPQRGEIQRLKASRTGRWLISLAGGNVMLRDAGTGQVAKVLDEGMGNDYIRKMQDADFLADDQGVLTTPSDWMLAMGQADGRTFEVVPLADGQATADFPRVSRNGLGAIRSDGRQIARVAGRQLQLWDIDGGRLASSVPLPDGMAAHNMAFAPDGRSVWVLGGLLQGDGKAWDRKTHLWRIDPATGGALLHLPFGSEMSLALAVSPDGARVAVATANGEMQVHASNDGRPLARFKSQRGLGESLASAIGGPQERHVRQLRFSPDGRQLLATEALQRSEVWDIASGTLLRELPHQAADYLPDGSLLVGGTGVLKLLAPPPSGAEATWWEHDYTRSLGVDTIIHHIKASASGGLAAVARESAIELWSVSERRVVKTLRSATGGIFDGAGMQFSADGTRLVVTSGQDTRIWSVGKGEELVRLLELGDGEWVAMTPQGYFSASSPKAADAITIKHEGQLMALGQFYEAFYRPDLVLAALSGQEVPVLPSGSMAGVLLQLPPKVAHVTLDGPTTGATVKVRYALNVQAGGLGDVRIYHNGKLVRWDRGQGQSVQPGTALAAAAPTGSRRGLAAFGEEGWDQQLRGLARAPAQQAPGPLAALAATEGMVELPTVPGRNEVSVLAFNANNTVASQAGQLRFDSALPVSPPSLYMLAVGINEYADARARLKYAAKDAADVLDQFAAKAGRLYGQGRVHITKLIDREATREKIIASLDELARSARPTDHVMLFVAGHGVLVNGGYHMVAANFDGALLPGNTISAEEIVDRSRQIPALSQWLVFDTCHAGGLGDLLRGLHDSRVQVLARQSGMHVFAAASTTEEALDGYEGNGLFTHSLLDGIGNALSADANADRQVSIVELGAFTQARTRELARRLKHRQEPVIVHHGNDRFVAN